MSANRGSRPCSADLVTAPKPPATTVPTLSIRGPSSVRGSSPLIIVDGVPVGSIDITALDVESVEIMKAACGTCEERSAYPQGWGNAGGDDGLRGW